MVRKCALPRAVQSATGIKKVVSVETHVQLADYFFKIQVQNQNHYARYLSIISPVSTSTFERFGCIRAVASVLLR